MNEYTFKNEIAKARVSQTKNNNPDYWIGYERGLRRQYYGVSFGTKEDHIRWLLADGNEPQRQRSKGYRDGLYAE
jgi:hypothetical protein